jgi:hypothetical protein
MNEAQVDEHLSGLLEASGANGNAPRNGKVAVAVEGP